MLDKLGDFKLLDLLGEGGMGTVYRAIQEPLGREVAVKVLPERLTRNPRFVQRFYREARSAASLVHPNVIQIFSLGQDEDAGLHYYAMEWVRGKDLSQILKSGAKFSVKQVINILVQVGEAMGAAAEAGIIHRDIKPANIMLTNQGQVKVMDFGLAKMTNDTMDVTAAGTIVGTANYMSPEQGQGKPLDCRTDIYSLGVVFFELLTGHPPFKADDPSAVIYQHIYEKPRKPSDLNSKVPPAIDRLVLRMMAKEPGDRVQNPAELVSELKKIKRALSSAKTEDKEKTVRRAPVKKDTDTVEGLASFQQERAPVEARAEAGTVLICEGSEYIRRMYRSVLMGQYAVASVGSGKECIDLVQDGHPDVLVLDLGIKDPGGYTVLDRVSASCPDTAIIVVTGDRRPSTVERLARYKLAGVMVKPLRMPDLRAKVEELLGTAAPAASAKGSRAAAVPRRSRTAPVRRPTSRGFVQKAARQEEATQAKLNVAGLAGKLLGRQDGEKARMLSRRIKMGSPNQIISIIRDMFGDLKEEEAWKLAIYAFKEGDHRVRILTSEIAASRFEPGKAAQLLTRFAADEDYRVRIAALRELAQCNAPDAEDFLARFLSDESWKVCREAARGIEKITGGRHLNEALVIYYARNQKPPPLYMQRLVKASNPVETVERLEHVARQSKSSRIKEFVASLLAQANSKVVVPTLLKLLEDQHPGVRTAAARALAGFPTDMVKRALFARLTDDRFGVLKAVADTLGVFNLQRATQALIKLFSTMGKRVPKAAAEFIMACDAGPNVFAETLAGLDECPEQTRQVIAFVLKRLYETDEAVTSIVRRLRSRKSDERKIAIRDVSDRMARFLIA